MTQYRLKHDLPNAKAGDIFEVEEGCVGMFKIDKSGKSECFFDTGQPMQGNLYAIGKTALDTLLKLAIEMAESEEI